MYTNSMTTKETATTMAEVCRSCLSIESKTTPLSGELDSLFSLITGFKVHQWEPSSVCYLCLAVLVKCKKFKDQCCTVDGILAKMVVDGKLNLSSIKKLDRVKLGLDSLTKAQNLNSTIDLYPTLSDPIKQEIDDKYINIEINVLNTKPILNLNNVLYEETKDETKIDAFKETIENTNQSKSNINIIDGENEYEIPNEDYLNSIEDTDSDTDLKTIKMKTSQKKNLKTKLKPHNKLTTKPKRKRSKTKDTDTKVNKIEKDNKKKNNFKQKESSSDRKKVTYEDLKKAHEIFKENFKIYKFDIDEQMKEFDKRKESPAYLERPFKCDVCFKGFHMASVHKKHMLSHEEQTSNYCPICRIYFKTTRNYKVHKHQHEHKYTCVHCDFVSDRRSSASTHVKSHSGNIDRCMECGREFRHRTSYANHLRVAHPSRFACADCGFTFVSQAGLEQHIVVAHVRRREILPDGPECLHCKIKFSNENALAVHIGISHPDKSAAKGKIKYINDNYKNTVKLTKYSFRKKNKLTDIVCEKCGEHLRTQLQYHWHFTKRHPNEIRTQYPHKSVLCDLCGKTLKSELHLKYHMEDHNKTLISKCDLCPKTFSNRFAFYRHKYSHKNAGLKKANVQRYACEQCGVSFSSYSNRDRHVKFVHSNERHFFCEYCNKGFKSDQEKRTHIDHVHFKKPWPKRSRGRPKTAHDDGPSEWPTT